MTVINQLHQRIQAVDPNTGQLTPHFFRWLVYVWERTGGPDDAIEELEHGELYEPGTIDSALVEAKDQLDELENLASEKDSLIHELTDRIDDLEELEYIDSQKDAYITELSGRIDELENSMQEKDVQIEELRNDLKKYALLLS